MPKPETRSDAKVFHSEFDIRISFVIRFSVFGFRFSVFPSRLLVRRGRGLGRRGLALAGLGVAFRQKLIEFPTVVGVHQPLLAGPVRLVTEPDVLAGVKGKGRVVTRTSDKATWEWTDRKSVGEGKSI